MCAEDVGGIRRTRLLDDFCVPGSYYSSTVYVEAVVYVH
jgi:hypothetical protein